MQNDLNTTTSLARARDAGSACKFDQSPADRPILYVAELSHISDHPHWANRASFSLRQHDCLRLSSLWTGSGWWRLSHRCDTSGRANRFRCSRWSEACQTGGVCNSPCDVIRSRYVYVTVGVLHSAFTCKIFNCRHGDTFEIILQGVFLL